MNTDLELKRKRIETGVKIAGLAVAGFFVAPFVFVAIQGLVGLIAAAIVGWAVVFFTPVVGRTLANWRLKALKAEASRNPVETLQNEYVKKTAALAQFRENIGKFTGQVLTFADQVKQYVKDGLEDADTYVEQLTKMRQLLQLRKDKYAEAQEMLVAFDETIKRTDRKWKMALAACAMNEAAGQIAGDAFDKICIETALDSVQQKLNQSFADLEIALLDDDKAKAKQMYAAKQPKLLGEPVPVTVIPVSNVKTRVEVRA